MRLWKAVWRRDCWEGEEDGEDDDGEEGGDDGSGGGSCFLCRGRIVYVPVSQMRRDPVAGEAVSMR